MPDFLETAEAWGRAKKNKAGWIEVAGELSWFPCQSELARLEPRATKIARLPFSLVE
jgi:hypothetical protein